MMIIVDQLTFVFDFMLRFHELLWHDALIILVVCCACACVCLCVFFFGFISTKEIFNLHCKPTPS